jgi:hypothetical protein
VVQIRCLYHVGMYWGVWSDGLTVLVEDVEALLHQQRRIQYDQAIADGQHIVARPGLQESAYGPLGSCERVRIRFNLRQALPGPLFVPCLPEKSSVVIAGASGRQKQARQESDDSLPYLRQTFCSMSKLCVENRIGDFCVVTMGTSDG